MHFFFFSRFAEESVVVTGNHIHFQKRNIEVWLFWKLFSSNTQGLLNRPSFHTIIQCYDKYQTILYVHQQNVQYFTFDCRNKLVH